MPARKAAAAPARARSGPSRGGDRAGRRTTSGGSSRAAEAGQSGQADPSVSPASTVSSASSGADRTDGPPERAGTPAQGRALRARGRRTLGRLLDAGIEVFSTRGYHAARVDDIVKAAKTSHGTFYLYFANKEDLFSALIADVAEQLAGLADSLGPITPDRAGRDELAAWLGRFTEMYAHYGPILRTWTEAEIDTNAAGRLGTDLLGDLAATLTDRIARRAAPPRGIPFDPDLASLALVAMVERCSYFVLSGQVDAHGAEVSDTLASVIHGALFGPGADGART